jgi:hypothetical protein
MSDVEAQIRWNYEVFRQKLPELLVAHPGKFALMHDGEIVEFFDTAHDAYVAGKKLFEAPHPFSVQEIIDPPANLGFFSHALL